MFALCNPSQWMASASLQLNVLPEGYEWKPMIVAYLSEMSALQYLKKMMQLTDLMLDVHHDNRTEARLSSMIML